jgi:NADH:ubiquinone oxidoreductase subunit 5 (subunit L)/multisubunit Na+/H+ antiporter MnhA subunit
MGGLSIYMPFTSSCLMVPNFAVSGILFLPGFYSKDFILELFSVRYVSIRMLECLTEADNVISKAGTGLSGV